MLGSIRLVIAIFIFGSSQEEAEYGSQSDSYQNAGDSFLCHCALRVREPAIVARTASTEKAVALDADLIERHMPDRLHVLCHVDIGGKRLIPRILRRG